MLELRLFVHARQQYDMVMLPAIVLALAPFLLVPYADEGSIVGWRRLGKQTAGFLKCPGARSLYV